MVKNYVIEFRTPKLSKGDVSIRQGVLRDADNERMSGMSGGRVHTNLL